MTAVLQGRNSLSSSEPPFATRPSLNQRRPAECTPSKAFVEHCLSVTSCESVGICARPISIPMDYQTSGSARPSVGFRTVTFRTLPFRRSSRAGRSVIGVFGLDSQFGVAPPDLLGTGTGYRSLIPDKASGGWGVIPDFCEQEPEP
jgi:hypothetical protein